MTEKLYLNNSYLKEFKARVISIDNNLVILDRTAFFPTGGGQLCDIGTLSTNGIVHNVIETLKSNESVMHKLENVTGLNIGDEVYGKIDWDRRYALMKLHTALHIIDAIVIKKYSNGQITGGQIYEHKARIDFDMEGLNRELTNQIIMDSQQLIDQAHEVRIRTIPKDEAMKIEGLARTVPGAELLKRLDTVRVVDIGDVDFQLDGGTHVANTREIGKLKLIGYENKGSRRKRIEIALE